MSLILTTYSFFNHNLHDLFTFIVIICEALINVFGDKPEVNLIQGSVLLLSNNLNSQMRQLSISSISYIIIGSPIYLWQYVISILIAQYNNASHYYFNFYNKGKSISVLFPGYSDVSISRATSLVVAGYTGKPYSHLNAFNLFFKFTISWLVSLFLACFVLLMLFILSDIPVNKFLFTAVSIGFFVYLLISGFVFFLNNYSYSKYTTAMHRYWRSTLSIFWLLEGFLFCVFLYLAVFSSQEPFFGYDNPQFMNDFTYPWSLFTQETSMLIFIILLVSYALVSLKDISTFKIYTIIIVTTALFLSMAWGEFYQFYYVLNHYNALDWVFDEDTNTWSMDFETNNTSILLHFITICIIAKFWHFVFILGFWIFSVSSWLQAGNIHYSLFSSNLQNFVILYLLNWIVMYPWFNYAFSSHLYNNYTWMYTNFSNTGSRIFFIDIVNYGYAIVESINPFSYPIVLNVMYGYFYSCWYGTGAVFSFFGYFDFLDHYALTGEY